MQVKSPSSRRRAYGNHVKLATNDALLAMIAFINKNDVAEGLVIAFGERYVRKLFGVSLGKIL